MLEQPTAALRTTRSGGIINRSMTMSPQQRGRVTRGSTRGSNRNIQPIVWGQNQELQMMGGELKFLHVYGKSLCSIILIALLSLPGIPGRQQQPFPSPTNRGGRARRGPRGRGAPSSSNYGNMRY